MWAYNQTVPSDELYHYGVKGMKWGHRKAIYDIGNGSTRRIKSISNESQNIGKSSSSNRSSSSSGKSVSSNDKSASRKSTAKKVAIGVAATAAIVGAAYGGYKLNKFVRAQNENIRVGEQLVKASKFIDREKSTINSMNSNNSNFGSFIEKSLRDDAVRVGTDAARNDSFGTAARNVYNQYKSLRRK